MDVERKKGRLQTQHPTELQRYLMNFTCGHFQPEPKHFGRGRLRQERLATYFNRPCFACASAKAKAQADRLTMIDGSPRSAESKQATFDRWNAKLYRTYLHHTEG